MISQCFPFNHCGTDPHKPLGQQRDRKKMQRYKNKSLPNQPKELASEVKIPPSPE